MMSSTLGAFSASALDLEAVRKLPLDNNQGGFMAVRGPNGEVLGHLSPGLGFKNGIPPKSPLSETCRPTADTKLVMGFLDSYVKSRATHTKARDESISALKRLYGVMEAKGLEFKDVTESQAQQQKIPHLSWGIARVPSAKLTTDIIGEEALVAQQEIERKPEMRKMIQESLRLEIEIATRVGILAEIDQRISMLGVYCLPRDHK